MLQEHWAGRYYEGVDSVLGHHTGYHLGLGLHFNLDFDWDSDLGFYLHFHLLLDHLYWPSFIIAEFAFFLFFSS